MRLIKVENEKDWQSVGGLLGLLFDHENSLREDRKPTEQIVEGGLKYIRNNIQKTDGAVFLAQDGQTDVGFIAGWVTSGDGLDQGDNRLGYISDAFVIEDYRRKGLFKQLVGAMAQYYRSIGVLKLSIDTLGTNVEMQNVLNKSGFSTHRILYEMKV